MFAPYWTGLEQQVTQLQQDFTECELKLEENLDRQLYRIDLLLSTKEPVESVVLDNDSLVAALNGDFSESVQVPLDVSCAF